LLSRYHSWHELKARDGPKIFQEGMAAARDNGERRALLFFLRMRPGFWREWGR